MANTTKKVVKKTTAKKKKMTTAGKRTLVKKAAVKTAKAKAKPAAAASYKVGEGDKAPDFSLPATSGRTLSLKDFSGRKLVLYFYPKDSTPGCTIEGHDFKRLLPEFKKAGVEVVGVSRDSLKSHENFREKCGFPFELISDADGKLCKSFDVLQMKKLYGRSFEGIERSTFVIDASGRIAKEWRKVQVNGHADEVLSAVRSL